MIPVGFPEQTGKLLGGGNDPNGKAVLDLPVFHGDGQTISCWRPTWRERIAILVFGRVWLSVMGRHLPPVWIGGMRTPFEPDTSPKPPLNGRTRPDPNRY